MKYPLRNTLLFFCLLIFSCSLCFGQAPKEITNIQVISDAKQVALIRTTLEKKIPAQRARDFATTRKQNLVSAYKLGDKTVVPAIIKNLEDASRKIRNIQLEDLQRIFPWEDNGFTGITEQAIIDRILACVNDTATEKMAVNTAGRCRVPGYDPVLEERLLSGKSVARATLIYWLGHSARSERSLDHIGRLLKEDQITANEMNEVVYALHLFAEKGNAVIKSKAIAIGFALYNNEAMRPALKEATTWASYTVYENLVDFLLKYGDKQVIPIAKIEYQQEHSKVSSLQVLINLECNTYIDTLRRLIIEDPSIALRVLSGVDKQYIDNKMLESLLISFGKNKHPYESEYRTITKLFIKTNAGNYIQKCESITPNVKLTTQLKRIYKYLYIPPDQVLRSLKNKKLINQIPDFAAQVQIADDDYSPVSFIEDILDSQRVLLTVDPESSRYPIDYDTLLTRFAGKSEGTLKDMLVYTEATKNASNHYDYTTTIIYKKHAFIAHPKDLYESRPRVYDLETVEALLNAVLERSGNSKRFFVHSTGEDYQYFFTPPGSVEQIWKEFSF